MDEYLSVKEFASKAGISNQAVYKQMSGRLEKYVVVVNGHRAIKAAALQAFYGDTAKQPTNPDSWQLTQLTQTLTDLKSQLDELQTKVDKDQEERDFLKEQIRQKDKTIDELHRRLEAAQQLDFIHCQRLQEIEQRNKAPEIIATAEDAAPDHTDLGASSAEQPQAEGPKTQRGVLSRLFARLGL